MASSIVSPTDPFDAHPKLARDVALARAQKLDTFSDDQYRHTARVVTARLPGLELLTIRPNGRYGESSLVVFTWNADLLVSRGILKPTQIPVLPKRTFTNISKGATSSDCLCVRRVRGGRLRVRVDIRDDVSEDHPLAMFRPSMIRAKAASPRIRPAWLTLVADNSNPVPGQSAPRGQLSLIVNKD